MRSSHPVGKFKMRILKVLCCESFGPGKLATNSTTQFSRSNIIHLRYVHGSLMNVFQMVDSVRKNFISCSKFLSYLWVRHSPHLPSTETPSFKAETGQECLHVTLLAGLLAVKSCKNCDGARPCPRCIKNGISEECVDSQRKERPMKLKRRPYIRSATKRCVSGST